MKMTKLNAWIGAVALSLLVSTLDASPADAATFNLNGYPCKVYSYYSNATYTVSMYTGPSCTGSFIATPQVRTTVFEGADGYYDAMLAPMVAAVAGDTRISGTYTTYTFFGSTFYVFDNVQFNAN